MTTINANRTHICLSYVNLTSTDEGPAGNTVSFKCAYITFTYTQTKSPPNYKDGRPAINDPPSSTMCAPVTCAEAGLTRKSTTECEPCIYYTGSIERTYQHLPCPVVHQHDLARREQHIRNQERNIAQIQTHGLMTDDSVAGCFEAICGHL